MLDEQTIKRGCRLLTDSRIQPLQTGVHLISPSPETVFLTRAIFALPRKFPLKRMAVNVCDRWNGNSLNVFRCDRFGLTKAQLVDKSLSVDSNFNSFAAIALR